MMSVNEELWKSIDGFPNYEVSNQGRVRNKKTGKILKPDACRDGYLRVTLYGDKGPKHFFIHVLVAKMFIGDKPAGLEVDHLNGDKSNNRVENLQYCTSKENKERAINLGLRDRIPRATVEASSKARMSPVQILETGEMFDGIQTCAEKIGGHAQDISSCLTGKALSYKGLHFKRVTKEDYAQYKNTTRKPFLYPYQMDAVKRMKNGCVLNGGVGSGKSRTGLYYYFKEQGGSIDPDYVPMKNPKDLYIITTAQKRDTLEFEGELAPFLLSTNPEVNYYKNKVVIDSWNNIKKYKDIHGAFFLFDEQRVCGSGAWVKAFLDIARKNDWILLSATAGDTWSDYIPLMIANGFYKNKTEFTRRHIVYSRFTKYPKVDRYLETGRLIRLRDSILIDMDFKRKTIAHHEDVYVKYDISKYKDAGKLRWDPYKNEPIPNASVLCYVWRKIVNTDESRQVALLEIFEKHPKMIVFYNFDYELDILRCLFPGVEVAEWNGHKHQPIPKGKTWVYLVQYTAGNAGWNCITTDTIVFYSQNYSYKVMQQASGRIDRLNTPYTDLYYYHLKSRSGIDLAISRALHEKRNFNERKYMEERRKENGTG